jgi:hypothetical protein
MAIDFGSALSGIGSIGSGIASFFGAKSAQKKQLRAARKEAQRNRDFQERMRNTAYQAATKDMRKAGLNPILAYRQGPASSPSGSVAQIPDLTKAVSEAGSTAQSTFSAMQQARQVMAQTKVMEQQAKKVEAEAKILGPRAELYEEATAAIKAFLEDPQKYLPSAANITTALDIVNDGRTEVSRRATNAHGNFFGNMEAAFTEGPEKTLQHWIDQTEKMLNSIRGRYGNEEQRRRHGRQK